MSNDSKCDSFQNRVQKLRSLREKLCDQKSEWTDAFKARDFVIDELQEMHLKLSQADSIATPEWCKEKVEHILVEMCALPIAIGDNDA